jgi:S1-C subfamily serine protease
MVRQRCLVRGERLGLADLGKPDQLELTLRLEGPDSRSIRALCLCLDSSRKIIRGNEVLGLHRPISDCKGIQATASSDAVVRFALNLPKIDATTQQIVLCLGFVDADGVNDAGCITRGSVDILGETGCSACFSFTSADFDREKALSLIEIYRHNKNWRMAVPGAGWRGGLAPMLSNFGGDTALLKAVIAGEANPASSANETLKEPIPLPSHWAGAIQPTLPRDLQTMVGLVIVYDADEKVYTGTGFVISPGGFILTCAHVVQNAVRIGIILEPSQDVRTLVLVAVDAASDVAVLWLADRRGHHCWMVLSDCQHVSALGDPIGIIGYPLGIDLGREISYCEGIINSVRQFENRDVLQIDAGAAPGSSGSPVFCRRTHQVIGLLTGGLELQKGGMHVNFAVDMRFVRRLGWFTSL